jgi:hypothetical protein
VVRVAAAGPSDQFGQAFARLQDYCGYAVAQEGALAVQVEGTDCSAGGQGSAGVEERVLVGLDEVGRGYDDAVDPAGADQRCGVGQRRTG